MSKLLLQGAKGPRTPVEDPNDLRSKSTAEFLELISDGVIEGWGESNPGRSIFFNDTPVLNENGEPNFKGVAYQLRTGTADQDPIPGFFNARGHIEVGQEVTKENSRTVTITDPDIDFVRVTVGTPQLFETNAKTGDVRKSQLHYTIDARALGSGGSWTTMVDSIMDGKTNSGYQRLHRFALPQGDGPFEVRVNRITDDSEDSKLQNKLYFESYDAITTGKFSYPNSALIGMTIDAEQFGSAVPTRSYDIKGRRIRVPSNYNPATRNYNGPWDGTFIQEWSDNPAYVLLDLLMGQRVGLGLREHQIDKTAIYSIGRYCDAVDGNGNFLGVPDGKTGMMPRHTFNGVIDGREDAYAVLNKVAASFRGLLYWSAGTVIPVADRPAPVKRLVNQADVIDGKFTYSSTAIKARHTVAIVTYTDPADGDRPAPAIYENRDGIIRYGYNKIEVSLLGCRNRIEALRYGKWLIQTEQQCTESVTYRAGWDHLDVMPGDLVEIADPNYAGARMGGRLGAVAGNSVTLDAPLPAVAGVQSIAVHQTDGSIVEREITSVVGQVLTLDGPVSAEPGAVYILTASSLAPRPFRVIGVTETEDRGVYEISAIQHDPGLYARVDEAPELDSDPSPPYQDNGAVEIPPVTMLKATEDLHFVNGLPASRLSISWVTPNHPAVRGVEALVQTPGGVWQDHSPSAGSSIDIDNAPVGLWVIRVTALTNDGRRSRPAEITYTVLGKSEPPGQPTGVQVTGGIRQIATTWINPPDSDLSHIEVWASRQNDRLAATRLGTSRATSFIHAGLGGLETWYYWVRAVDIAGNIGDFNSNLGTVGTTEMLDPSDLGRAVLDNWRDMIAWEVPSIDHTLLDDRIRQIADGGPYHEAILESLRLNASRWDEIKKERGASDSSFAAVEHTSQQHADSISAWAKEVTILGAEFDDNTVIFSDSIEALALADSVIGERVTQLSIEMLATISGAVTEISKVVVDGDSISASLVNDLRVEWGSNNASVARSLEALVGADTVMATDIGLLLARATAAEAAILSEQIARVSSDAVLTSEIKEARAFTTSQVASMKSEVMTEVNNSYAKSSSVTQLESRVSSDYAALKNLEQTLVGPNGIAETRWAVVADVNGYVTGINFLAKAAPGVPARSAFIVNVDDFQIAAPNQNLKTAQPIFTVSNGQVVIDGKARIKEASIDTLKIGKDQVTVPVTRHNSNFIDLKNGKEEKVHEIRMPASTVPRTDLILVSWMHQTHYPGAVDVWLSILNESPPYYAISQPGTLNAFTYGKVVPAGVATTYSFYMRGWNGGTARVMHVGMSVIGAMR